jgi:integrase
VKPSTLSGYQSIVRHLDLELGAIPLEDLTTEGLEAWRSKWALNSAPSNRTVQAYLVALKSILKRARRLWKLPMNPADDLDLPRVRNTSVIDVYTPEEVWALVREADCDQDAAACLVAAFVGLRMGELLALRWREVDFARRMVRVTLNYTHRREGTPKSDRMRAVPMADPVAQALARLSQREHFTAESNLVFCGGVGQHLNPKELRRRYRQTQEAAKLRPLRFHDLRHTFGTLAINRASALQVKTWMGHSDLKTTERYLHYREQTDEAELLSGAFQPPTETRVPNCVPKRSLLSKTERT